MRSALKRLKTVEHSLTPKQAVILWMEEAHRFTNPYDYLKSLRDLPEASYPLPNLAQQIEDSVREAMKGEPRDEVTRAVREAVRDVIFLNYLHLEVNRSVTEESRSYNYRALHLTTDAL